MTPPPTNDNFQFIFSLIVELCYWESIAAFCFVAFAIFLFLAYSSIISWIVFLWVLLFSFWLYNIEIYIFVLFFNFKMIANICLIEKNSFLNRNCKLISKNRFLWNVYIIKNDRNEENHSFGSTYQTKINMTIHNSEFTW